MRMLYHWSPCKDGVVSLLRLPIAGYRKHVLFVMSFLFSFTFQEDQMNCLPTF